MNNYIITIDSGTTNTRVLLWDNEHKICAIEKREAGLRNCAIDGNTDVVRTTLKECISEVLKKQNISFEQVDKIMLTGTLTTEMGLLPIGQIPAPVGLEELAKATKSAVFPDVAPMPINFIPGVKCLGNFEDEFENMDSMGGEEVETMALLSLLDSKGPYLFAFPGSHMKYVYVNEEGKICQSFTTISGEILYSITNNTVISTSVNHSFVDVEDYDKDMILRGFRYAQRVGLVRSAFTTRMYYRFVKDDSVKAANYLMGCVYQGDIAALHELDRLFGVKDCPIIVTGRGTVTDAIVDMLHEDGYFSNVSKYFDNSVPLSGLGALLVAKKLSELN